MREVFTALQARFAELDGFDKTAFLCEIPANGLLRERIRITASLGRKFCKLMFLLRLEMYFHTGESRDTNRTCQRADRGSTYNVPAGTLPPWYLPCSIP